MSPVGYGRLWLPQPMAVQESSRKKELGLGSGGLQGGHAPPTCTIHAQLNWQLVDDSGTAAG